MSADTEALLATVREALETIPGTPCSCPKHAYVLEAHAALDSLAAELERVKAERDEAGRAGAQRTVRAQKRADAAEARLNIALSALREIQAVQPKRVAWFREHDVVFDKAPGGDDYWQNVAFQIYTDDCEVESLACAAIAEIEGEA